MRALTFLALLVGIGAAAAAVDGPPGAEPAWLIARPANAKDYSSETVRRFRDLVRHEAWHEPSWNAQGTLQTVHAKTGLVFVLIPAGAFSMGAPAEETGSRNEERPHHLVIIDTFLICRTECSQAAWTKGGGRNRSCKRGDDHPVENVSQVDGRGWCEGLGLRLPSEAEWEYACRAGTTTRFWSGDGEADLARVGWCEANSGRRSHAIGERPANPLGLTDMHGNVAEWCEDRWHTSYATDGRPDDGTAWTRACGRHGSVFRGGSWNEAPADCRSARRFGRAGDSRCAHVGFRPAASLPE